MPQAPPCSPDDCSPLPFEVRPLPPELLSNAFSGNTKATLDASSGEVEKKVSTKKQGKRGREYSESDDEAETKKQRRRCH